MDPVNPTQKEYKRDAPQLTPFYKSKEKNTSFGAQYFIDSNMISTFQNYTISQDTNVNG